MPRLDLVEASLRHGQQSLLLSRLRQRHAVRAAELLDGCGFAALEVFGGATFEAQLRFLGEDPFDRLRAIRAAAPSTPLMATLSGQMLVGHRHVADDVVESFIHLTAGAGIDILRLLDPLNDVANLRVAVAAGKAARLRVEGVVICTDSPTPVLAGVAAALAALGCDSICLHDPLGILGAARAAELVTAVAGVTGRPVTASFCSQTGQADLAYQAAHRAGASRVDVCVSPLGGGAAYTPAEALIAGLDGTEDASAVELETVNRVAAFLDDVAPLYADLVDPALWRFDGAALRGLLPISALGHGLAELRERNALHRLADVEAEITRVRRELGNPPLVSPLREVITTQAVYNVFDGDRYATVIQEVKDYCMGHFGTPPDAIDPEVRQLVNGRDVPISCRPADLLGVGLPAAAAALESEGVRTDPEAVVTYALFGADFLAFARHETVVELLGDEAEGALPPGPAAAAEAPEVAPDPAAQGGAVRDLRVEVDGEVYQVRVFGAGAGTTGPGAGTEDAAPVRVKEGTLTAPMQGLILKVRVNPGDRVEIGDVVVVLEAMKMQNDIAATRRGSVGAVHVREGDVVTPGTPLIDIE